MRDHSGFFARLRHGLEKSMVSRLVSSICWVAVVTVAAWQTTNAEELSGPGYDERLAWARQLLTAIADRVTPIVVDYANGHTGYIATAAAYEAGGYEPGASPLLPEAETVILAELGKLTDQMVGDVFATFSKHPRDLNKRAGGTASVTPAKTDQD